MSNVKSLDDYKAEKLVKEVDQLCLDSEKALNEIEEMAFLAAQYGDTEMLDFIQKELDALNDAMKELGLDKDEDTENR